jgi:hypothetical protein
MVLPSLLFAFALGIGANASNATPSQIRLCSALAKGDGHVERSCRAHSVNFESPPQLIEACTKLDPNPDVRIRCLRSGANLEVFALCRSLNFNLSNTLTCLRSYPTSELLTACQKGGSGEEFLMACLRSGREPAQISACTQLFNQPSERAKCWVFNIPHLQASVCGRRNSSSARFDCLKEEVASQEYDARLDQRDLKRSLASEPQR